MKASFLRIMNLQQKLPGLLILLMMFSPVGTLAQEGPGWPCFHGPDRTNKSQETGLLKSWPEQGPEMIWSVAGLGKGYSTVSFGEGLIFTSGMVDRQTYVYAYDLEGNLVWKRSTGKAWETDLPWATSYDGSRSTPTYYDGVVYHLGDMGRLTAFESRTGNEIWKMELRERFEAEIPEYGYSESVLVKGDRLYCCPAGKKAYIICLDRHSGDLVWQNSDIPGPAGNSSLIMFESGGYTQLAGLSATCLFGVDTDTGKLLWKVDFENSRTNNITDAIYVDGHIFASTGYGKGCIFVKMVPSGGGIKTETVWETTLLDNHHGGVILHEGYLYGAGSDSRGWTCLDLNSGFPLWKTGGKGSLTFADDMLYCLDERGVMTLVKATPKAYLETGRFEVPEGGDGPHWAHPVVFGGRLYIRHDDKLFVYNLYS